MVKDNGALCDDLEGAHISTTHEFPYIFIFNMYFYKMENRDCFFLHNVLDF